jgi:hypothetical protein
MDLTTIIVLALATWRVTSLLVNEEGPWGILVRLRHFVGVRYDEYSQVYGTNILAEGLSCTWCASVWLGAAMTAAALAAPDVALWLALPFALSASAILMERLVDGKSEHGYPPEPG